MMIARFFTIFGSPEHAGLMVNAMSSVASGFTILWRYFAWSNQTIAVFAFACISIYLGGRGYKHAPFMAIIPGAWYTFITVTFIANAAIGFNIPMNIAYVIGVVAAVLYIGAIMRAMGRLYTSKLPIEDTPVYA